MKTNNTCHGCGAEIKWIRTATGRTMPVDAEPVWIRPDKGGVSFVAKDGSIIFGMEVGDAWEDCGTGEKAIEAYISHFATCPCGAKYRHRKPRTRAPGYR